MAWFRQILNGHCYEFAAMIDLKTMRENGYYEEVNKDVAMTSEYAYNLKGDRVPTKFKAVAEEK